MKKSKKIYTAKEKTEKYTKEQILQSMKFSYRLRELRQKAGLSYDRLVDGLYKKCNYEITSKSLKNYETADINNVEFGKALGVSLKTVIALADFFEVSVDYLLGRSECTKPTYEEINKALGLSEASINRLVALKTHINTYSPNDKFTFINVLNLMLEDKDYKFTNFLRYLWKYFKAAKIKSEIERKDFNLILDMFKINYGHLKPEEKILLDFYIKTRNKNLNKRQLNKLKTERDKNFSSLDDRTKKTNLDVLELFKTMLDVKHSEFKEKLDFNLFMAQDSIKELIKDVDAEKLDIDDNSNSNM